MDACPYDAENDADNDSICGDADSCAHDSENDIDVDAICGDVDSCMFDAENDADSDDICSPYDLCSLDADNDLDSDLICGNVDSCPFDSDNDSDNDNMCNNEDSCPYDSGNDVDADGLCGSIDSCPYDYLNDYDSDSICGDVDSCSFDPNNDLDLDAKCDNSLCRDSLSFDVGFGPCELYAENRLLHSFCEIDGACTECACACASACDVNWDNCPLDADNDADSDNICGNLDSCPLDVDNDVDTDQVCGDEDTCPLDVLNDVDSDGLCAGADLCPFSNDNDDDCEIVALFSINVSLPLTCFNAGNVSANATEDIIKHAIVSISMFAESSIEVYLLQHVNITGGTILLEFTLVSNKHDVVYNDIEDATLLSGVENALINNGDCTRDVLTINISSINLLGHDAVVTAFFLTEASTSPTTTIPQINAAINDGDEDDMSDETDWTLIIIIISLIVLIMLIVVIVLIVIVSRKKKRKNTEEHVDPRKIAPSSFENFNKIRDDDSNSGATKTASDLIHGPIIKANPKIDYANKTRSKGPSKIGRQNQLTASKPMNSSADLDTSSVRSNAVDENPSLAATSKRNEPTSTTTRIDRVSILSNGIEGQDKVGDITELEIKKRSVRQKKSRIKRMAVKASVSTHELGKEIDAKAKAAKSKEELHTVETIKKKVPTSRRARKRATVRTRQKVAGNNIDLEVDDIPSPAAISPARSRSRRRRARMKAKKETVSQQTRGGDSPKESEDAITDNSTATVTVAPVAVGLRRGARRRRRRRSLQTVAKAVAAVSVGSQPDGAEKSQKVPSKIKAVEDLEKKEQPQATQVVLEAPKSEDSLSSSKQDTPLTEKDALADLDALEDWFFNEDTENDAVTGAGDSESAEASSNGKAKTTITNAAAIVENL
jgi:hypothetical protein